MSARIKCIAQFLGEVVETNDQLANEKPEWDLNAITKKTGVVSRRKVRPGDCASDLAAGASMELFRRHNVSPNSIDYLLFCTSAPDHQLPTTACLLQNRLGIPTSAGALDFNLGCSGYVYGLGLARGLVEAHLAQNVLLLTADTYTRFIGADNRSIRPLFGDAGSATLICDNDGPGIIGAFDFGTDGRGEFNLIRPGSGARRMQDALSCAQSAGVAAHLVENEIFMDGMKIFSFAISAVPASVARVLRKAGLSLAEIDWVVFHQASQFMLDHLVSKMEIPREKALIDFAMIGNTVSSTIPLVLDTQMTAGRFSPGDKILLCGFGVGYSWASCIIEWC